VSPLGKQPAFDAPAPAPPPLVAPEAPRAQPHTVADYADVLECPAELIASMPLATTLHCVDAAGRRFVVTTSREAYVAAAASGTPTFVGGELTAMACAVALGRVLYPAELSAWVARKMVEPAWRLTHADAVGEVYERPPLVKLGPMMSVLGAAITRVEVD
jgi:hypothetical protein